MPHWDGEIVYETFPARFGNWTLNEGSGDGIRAVEHDDFNAGFGGGFEKISERRLVGVKARACVLNVNDDGIERFEHVEWRMPGRVGRAISAVDGHAGGGVFRVGDIRCVERS